MFKRDYIWKQDDIIPIIRRVLNFQFSNYEMKQNYQNIVNHLSADQLKEIAQEIFLRQNERGQAIYHPLMTAFAISRSISRDVFKGWLDNELPSNNLHLYIKNFLLDGIFLLIPSSSSVSELIIGFVNVSKLRTDHSNFIFLDGDNLQLASIPIYRGLINIQTFGFFVQTIIPQFIEGYQQLYHHSYNLIILSYGTKKDAADVDLNMVSSLLVNNNLTDDHSANYYMITNDQYANEIELANIDLISNYFPNDSLYKWYDPKEEHEKWYYGHKEFIKGNLLRSLTANGSFLSWFIRLIKDNLSIKAIPEYADVFTAIRQSDNFDQVYKLIMEANIKQSQKDNLLSQYLVVVSSRYFSFDDLRQLFKDHLVYLMNNFQNFDLETFLSIPVNTIIYFFYPGTRFSDLIIHYFDFRYIFEIKNVIRYNDTITQIIFN